MNVEAMRFYCNTVPVCPWCEHKQETYAVANTQVEGETVEIECENCQGLISITKEPSPRYSTVASGCEVHELVKVKDVGASEGFTYICKRCKIQVAHLDRMAEGSYVVIDEEVKDLLDFIV